VLHTALNNNDLTAPITLDAASRAVDLELRTIARQRAALDAKEARLLREAERLQIWRQLGMPTALDYLERSVGYAPRTAQERLRVARALGELPAIEQALATGELAFSAVRELTRIATPDNEANWVKAVEGCNLRQIEEAVACHEPGDQPTDLPKPIVKNHVVRFELTPEVYAMMRQSRTLVTEERGHHVDDNELLATLCRGHLDRGPASHEVAEARFTIGITVCDGCKQGHQHGGGRMVPVDGAVVDMASCDAILIGSIDGAMPARASSEIPPAIRRFVWHRDGGMCQTPGCRSTVGVAIHHIKHREHGGTHDPANLTCRCFGCHLAAHTGKLEITGAAPHDVITRRIGPLGLMNASQFAAPPSMLDDIERTADDVEESSATAVPQIEIERATPSVLDDMIWPDAVAQAIEVRPPDAASTSSSPADTTSASRSGVGEQTLMPPPAPIDAVRTSRTPSCNANTTAASQRRIAEHRVATVTPTDNVWSNRAQSTPKTNAGPITTRSSPATSLPVPTEVDERTTPATRATDRASRLDEASVVAQARDALVQLGWKRAISHAAVEEARAHVGAGDLHELIREALRRCPKPGS
jgi:hypothetical protein